MDGAGAKGGVGGGWREEEVECGMMIEGGTRTRRDDVQGVSDKSK